MQAGSAASVGAVSGLWAVINAILGAITGTIGTALAKFGFLDKLLNMWGGASTVGLQVLLEKLQQTGSGVHLAPPQLERYREVVQSVAWANLHSASECQRGWAASCCAEAACP